MVIAPLVLSIFTPVGAPVNVNAGAGKPVAVTWNVPPVPLTTLVLLTLVITGDCVTVNVKFCVVLCGITAGFPVVAVITKVYEPAVTEGAKVITPFELTILTPDGGLPDNENVIGDVPVAITVNVPPMPAVTLILSAEVIAGGSGSCVTDRVKSCVASPELLVAITVK